jgi:hypothetical protein
VGGWNLQPLKKTQNLPNDNVNLIYSELVIVMLGTAWFLPSLLLSPKAYTLAVFIVNVVTATSTSAAIVVRANIIARTATCAFIDIFACLSTVTPLAAFTTSVTPATINYLSTQS